MADLHRDRTTNGPHGDTHLTRRLKGATRDHLALCGISTRDMRRTAWFAGWASTLCDACGAAADALDGG